MVTRSLDHLFGLAWVVFCIVCAEFWEVFEWEREEMTSESSITPMSGDKRFVRTSNMKGLEVMLLRRSNELGYWLVAIPDETICRLRLGDRVNVRTTDQGQKVGVTYILLPTGSSRQRQALMEKAEELIERGTSQVSIIGQGSWARLAVKRTIGLGSTLPIYGLRVLRWSARKPLRLAGFLAVLVVLQDVLRSVGFYDWVQEKIDVGFNRLANLVFVAMDASNGLSEALRVIRATYGTLSEFVEPWKIPYMMMMVILLGIYLKDMETSQTPLVTPGVTPKGSGNSTPAEEKRKKVLVNWTSKMETQEKLLKQVVSKLEEVEKSQRMSPEGDQEVLLMRETKIVAHHVESQLVSKKLWDKLRERLDTFEEAVKEGRERRRSTQLVAGQASAAGGPRMPKEERRKEDREKGEMEQDSGEVELSVLINRLERGSKSPQEIFVEALQEYQEADKELWATHFPPGFRERMAPRALGEIYSTGKTAKEMAKSWIKEKSLGHCDEAREIISTSAALDAMFLVDRTEGAINQVGTERLVRRVMGIRAAFQDVSGWKKKGNKKQPKIDYETWDRMDPGRKDRDHLFVNRRVEEELRTEMERDASMMKARAKLAEANKKS